MFSVRPAERCAERNPARVESSVREGADGGQPLVISVRYVAVRKRDPHCFGIIGGKEYWTINEIPELDRTRATKMNIIVVVD